MPESDRKQVRVRMAVALDEWERWSVLACQVGVPVERLIVLGASMALPELERRIGALVSPIAAPQLVATPAGAGELRAVTAKAELVPSSSGKGPGGKKKKKAH